MFFAHGQHTPFVELQVYQQSDAEQCHLDEVRAQHIGGPVRAQVDARWTNEHYEEGGNHQQPDTPPATTVEEDDPEGKQHSPEGNIGRDMSAGEALVVERSKNLDQPRAGARAIHNYLHQCVQYPTDRVNSREGDCFQAQIDDPENQDCQHNQPD